MLDQSLISLHMVARGALLLRYAIVSSDCFHLPCHLVIGRIFWVKLAKGLHVTECRGAVSALRSVESQAGKQIPIT